MQCKTKKSLLFLLLVLLEKKMCILCSEERTVSHENLSHILDSFYIVYDRRRRIHFSHVSANFLKRNNLNGFVHSTCFDFSSCGIVLLYCNSQPYWFHMKCQSHKKIYTFCQSFCLSSSSERDEKSNRRVIADVGLEQKKWAWSKCDAVTYIFLVPEQNSCILLGCYLCCETHAIAQKKSREIMKIAKARLASGWNVVGLRDHHCSVFVWIHHFGWFRIVDIYGYFPLLSNFSTARSFGCVCVLFLFILSTIG